MKALLGIVAAVLLVFLFIMFFDPGTSQAMQRHLAFALGFTVGMLFALFIGIACLLASNDSSHEVLPLIGVVGMFAAIGCAVAAAINVYRAFELGLRFFAF